jgi:hypothetical protein
MRLSTPGMVRMRTPSGGTAPRCAASPGPRRGDGDDHLLDLQRFDDLRHLRDVPEHRDAVDVLAVLGGVVVDEAHHLVAGPRAFLRISRMSISPPSPAPTRRIFLRWSRVPASAHLVPEISRSVRMLKRSPPTAKIEMSQSMHDTPTAAARAARRSARRAR